MDDILNDFIFLRVKCPICDHSLMDQENYVDGKPGVKLSVESAGNKGMIVLSAIYESYNYRCDIPIESGDIVTFSCPHCRKVITSKTECEYCEAAMVPLELDIGGKASICSRSGCKGHFLEFEDILLAFNKLYQLGDYKGPIPEGLKENGESTEIIKSGTFLNPYCPKCNKALIENGLITLKIINDKNEEGLVFLSPFLNVFTSRSTVFLKEDQTVKDVICPHCNTSVIDLNMSCEKCGSPAAKIKVSARTKFIDFYICSKKGCRWHGLSDEDLHEIDLEDSMEW